jgi:hypothetical protein
VSWLHLNFNTKLKLVIYRFYAKNEKKVLRLILDECHEALTSRRQRPQFDKLRRLADLPIQKIYLSASLPTRMKQTFLEEMCLPLSTTIIRAPVHQPHIRYHVIHVEPGVTTTLRFAIDLAKLLTAKVLGLSKQGIIFCTSRREADYMGEQFTKCVSHSDLGSKERSHNEGSWYAGFHQWISATTGMIHGIDHPNVGAVIFVELPYGLINIYQGAGRTGRNGDPSVAFLIDSHNIHAVAMEDRHQDFECRAEGNEWMENTIKCRRSGLSLLMDGEEATCDDIKTSQLCDVCDSTTELLKEVQLLIPDPIPASLTPSTTLMTNPCHTNTSSVTITEADDEEFSCYNEFDDATLMAVDLDECWAKCGIDFFIIHLFRVSKPVVVDSLNQPGNTHPSMPVKTDWPTVSSFGTLSAPSVNPTSAIQALASCSTARLAPPSNARPSMPVQLDKAIFGINQNYKEQKARILSDMASLLYGKCVVCWIWKSKLISRTKQHKPFLDCKEPSDGYVAHGVGWMAFKKQIRYEKKYQYCFNCGLSQILRLQPSCHPLFKRGEPMRCPLDDFVVLFIWFIRHNAAEWEKAVKRFSLRGLQYSMSLEEFGKWCSKGDGERDFYNGLELVLWYWQQRKDKPVAASTIY